MRILALVLALVLGPKLCPAETTNLGISQTAAVGNADLNGTVLYGRDGAVVRQVVIGSDGYLKVSFTTSAVTGGSGASDATTQRVIEASDSPVNTNLAVIAGAMTTSAGVFTSVTNVSTTFGAAVGTINLTTAAGSNGAYMVGITAAHGGAGIRYLFHPSAATAPSIQNLLDGGSYCGTTTTVQVDGYWVPGTHLSYVCSTGTTVTGSIQLRK